MKFWVLLLAGLISDTKAAGTPIIWYNEPYKPPVYDYISSYGYIQPDDYYKGDKNDPSLAYGYYMPYYGKTYYRQDPVSSYYYG